MTVPTSFSIVTIACSSAGRDGLDQLRRVFAARMAGRHGLTMAERRAGFAALMAALVPMSAPDMPRRERIGGIETEVHGDDAPSCGTVLYLHGGAYVSGGPATHRDFAMRLSRQAGARVVVPDYRLAPENPFPAAIDDAVTTFHAVRALWPDSPVVVGGDSAGGGLSLALALRLKAAGSPQPAGLMLLSPFVDLTLSSPSHRRLESSDPFLTTAGLAADVARYVPEPAQREEPLASPLFAALGGLPDTLLQVGSDEILLDDSLALVGRLRADSIGVEAELWDGMVHNWHLFPNWLPEAHAATARLGDFVRSKAGAPE